MSVFALVGDELRGWLAAAIEHAGISRVEFERLHADVPVLASEIEQICRTVPSGQAWMWAAMGAIEWAKSQRNP